ncbi:MULTISPECIES: TIM-barrel domain-containing protein [Actinomyces]|uniref:Alpha-glucosidase n=1 Tax=Actinomyces respiraculi TaxID=2744574 RepID=A0A7T0LMC0_9ACTO|nr:MULTISPECIES: TIM-barrel domain-containing protein [Actinomyces]QPL05968.1 alpha-glucosidase [Actinomyces respiraculi]
MTSPLSSGSADLRLAPARPEAVVAVGHDVRFTVLTDRLIRIERSASGTFTDAATQLVVSRDLGPVPTFEVRRGEDRVEILTEHLHLTYQPSRGFSRSGLKVSLRTGVLNAHGGTWYYGDTWDPDETFPTNLGGTCRTLDNADGRVRIEPGLLALHGLSVIDDSRSLLMQQDEWVRPRPCASPVDGSTDDEDLYLFGYGQEYARALTDFFALTGPTPLVPRALLGNWWSRYHTYTQESYLALMDRFASEKLPFSVAVIDMDWHWVNIDPAIGNGWTGYTWNTDLFPDPRGFLDALHERGMQVTLNLHPAGGVRRHESAYEPMMRALGKDPASGEAIPFNVGDPDFVAAYLDHAHHPLEDEGVDFWWLDWQQGGVTDIPGLDPLWMLNHVHYLDSGRERTRTLGDGSTETFRRRPVTFSRFADASSHRTPIGFSGDTYATWDTLRYQPEFTATAANIGYYWWSNDIGGHMFGVKDSEMAARWVQLGCFSPINRLHSTSSVFNSKEPWRYSRDARATMDAYLRLRHRLVPYLYTWARRAHTEGIGPVRPLFHDHPWRMGAYENRREYLFGDLLVIPVATRATPVTGLAAEAAWVPEGVWFDLPTGRRYEVSGTEGHSLSFHRDLAQVPVLARAGSVVPLADDVTEAAGANPRALGILLVPGADGELVMEEDDGSAEPGLDAVVRTRITLTWDGAAGTARVALSQEGPQGVVPAEREVVLHLLSTAVGWASVDGRPAEVREREADGFTLGAGVDIPLGTVRPSEGVSVELGGVSERTPDVSQEIFGLLEPAQIDYVIKDRAWGAVMSGATGTTLLSAMRAVGVPQDLVDAVAEVV